MPVRLILILTILLCIEGRVLTKKLCYNCGNNIPVNTTGISSSSDICATFDPSGFTTATTSLTLNSQTHVSQTECVKYYEYVVSSTPNLNSYVAFSVNFADFSDITSLTPVLIERNNSLPIIWIDSNGDPQQLANDLDINSYVNRKTYHYIKVNTSKLTVGTSIYIGVYKFAPTAASYYSGAVEYDISVSDSENCPANCNGNGICPEGIIFNYINFQGTCYCETGNFDLDCSILALKMALNENERENIPPYEWRYFYYVINDDTTDIRLNFTKNKGYLKSAMIFNKQTEYDLPNFIINSGIFSVPESQEGDFWVVTDATLEKNFGHTMLIGLYNPNNFLIKVNFNIIQSPDINPIRTTIMYVMIGVSAFLIVLWGIITVMKYKIQRDHEASEASSQQQDEQQDILSPEELEKFFPKRLFKELKTSFDQPTCSICLDEFQAETVCRQIYCEHIYHCKCIESWLSNHKSCPNCKKEVTKNAIEAFLEELEKIKNQINTQPKMEAKIDHIHLKISDKPIIKEPELVHTEECKEADMEERKISFEVKEYMKETENKMPDQKLPSVNSESQLEVNGEMESNKEKNVPISNDPKENHNAGINMSNKS